MFALLSPTIAAALIGAAGIISVALITLLRQWWVDRRLERAAATEEKLNHNDLLFDEYRDLVEQHRRDAKQAREELEEERAAMRRLRTERDEYRRRALHCEERWDELIQKESE